MCICDTARSRAHPPVSQGESFVCAAQYGCAVMTFEVDETAALLLLHNERTRNKPISRALPLSRSCNHIKLTIAVGLNTRHAHEHTHITSYLKGLALSVPVTLDLSVRSVLAATRLSSLRWPCDRSSAFDAVAVLSSVRVKPAVGTRRGGIVGIDRCCPCCF